MRELKKDSWSTGREDDRRRKKKKVRIKEEKMDGEGNAMVESSTEGPSDAAEVGLEANGENGDEKKREKKNKKKEKRRHAETGEGSEGTIKREVEEVPGLAKANDEKEEKVKKKKRKKDVANMGKEDGVPSATYDGKKKRKEKRRDMEANESSEGTTEREVEEGGKPAEADHEKQEKMKKNRRKHEASTDSEDGVPFATDEGKQRVKAEKCKEVVEERVGLQETRERKKKDNISKVGKDLKSFEAGVLENVSGSQEGSGGAIILQEHLIQHGDGRSLKENKVKRKKREHPDSEDIESVSELHTTKQQKPIAEDERIAEEGNSHGSRDGKRRKKNLEENNLGSSEDYKKQKAKDDLLRDGMDHMVRFSLTNKDWKKTKEEKKKNKDVIAEDMKASTEGISNTEIASENTKTKDSRKRSKVSADEGTSSVRNLDVRNAPTTAETKEKVKKVNFSGHVEVFPSTDDGKSNEQSDDDDGLVQGKRFTQEEDEMIKQAVFYYIEQNQLGEDGLDMVLKCRSHPQVRNCWKEIGAALPWRPRQSVYCRAHTLFQRSESRNWEPEEFDLIRRYYKENGPKWKEMADLLGKHRVHVKDTWRRIKLTNAKKGNWSQEEYQALFDLVNVDLQLKAFEEKKNKHGMLRENISWGAISEKLSTRHDAACCTKWYVQLTSSMVTQGLWADTDDYRLIDELLKLDASCVEDVEWDSLLENRSGDLCLKRWKQMARHIGGHREKSFMEQVELLATRYCPKMLQYRTRNPRKCDDGVGESDDDVDERWSSPVHVPSDGKSQ